MRPSCRRRRSILDKLSLEDFAPVRSRSAPGSAGAKSSESVVGVGVAVARGSDPLGVSIGVFWAEAGGRVCGRVLSDAGERGVGSEEACPAFFGGMRPDLAENVRLKRAEGEAVARRRAVHERRVECMGWTAGSTMSTF